MYKRQPNTNHGTHVAGTVAGNTQGWARDANIYNMAFQDGLTGVTDWSLKLWDYIRYFHNNKPINPATGRRNPTVVNNSWGQSYPKNIVKTEHAISVTYRGSTTNLSGYTEAQKKVALEAGGCSVGNYAFNDVGEDDFRGNVPAQTASMESDITDAINDGVIIVASAGNSYWNCEESGGPDCLLYTSPSPRDVP